MSEEAPFRRVVWIAAAGAVVMAAVLLMRATACSKKDDEITWKTYTAPDSSFKADFTSDPIVDTKARNVEGQTWKITSAHSQHGGHIYAIEYADMDQTPDASYAPQYLSEQLARWVKYQNSSIITEERTTISNLPAIHYTMNLGPMPAGGTSEFVVNGLAVLRGNRIFFVSGGTPAKERNAKDVKRFVDSFSVTPP